MEENREQKVIMMTLGSMLVGSLLFIFGISMAESFILLVCQYIIAMLLYLSSLLALKNYLKNNNKNIFKYLIVLNVLLIIVVTYAFISKL